MRIRHIAAPAAASALLLLAGCGSDSSSSTSASAAGSGAGSSSSAPSSSTSSAQAAASYTCVKGTVTASGSTALQPLVQKAATDYQTKCPGSTVTVSGGGSSTGLSNVDSGTSDIGDSDVPSSNAKSLKNQLTDHQVAVVVFAVVVNPKTNVTALTTQQIQDVFSGKVTNWKSVGGADVPVTLIERKPGSGTRLSFDKDVMAGTAESATPSSTQDSTSLVVSGVGAADGGVSYINAASVGSLTAVAIDQVKPGAATVADGTYKFFSHEHMYTNAAGSPAAQDFINFILSSDFQSSVSGLGFVPAAQATRQSAVDAG